MAILNYLLETWFHGTADAREIEKNKSFKNNITHITYINDLDLFEKKIADMKRFRDVGDEKSYLKVLDSMDSLKSKFSFNKPLFLTDKYEVAQSYANAFRSMDYQNALEKVIVIKEVNCNRIVEIDARGAKFDEIDIENVKNGFVNSGISQSEIEDIIKKFNFFRFVGKIKTDTIGAIASWFEFDCVDIKNVKDFHNNNRSRKTSTIRMVLTPSKVVI
jgi:hypothetical protein